MIHEQPGILAPIPALARYLQFRLIDADAARDALARLAAVPLGETLVVGIGQPLAAALGVDIAGLRLFPSFPASGVAIPSTPASLWCWLRGDDRGELLHQSRHIERLLTPAFAIESAVDAFRYGSGRDLTGYEDGTENPQGDAAREAALRDGASFVAVQQWAHDLDAFAAMNSREQDNAIGRRRSDNEELDDAPESAHVKRTAQENFSPEAFVVRRSMPWADQSGEGLMFVAFGCSFDAFEAQMRRIAGAEDGIVDALFRFTRPLTGAYFWCPPLRDGRLDFRSFGVGR